MTRGALVAVLALTGLLVPMGLAASRAEPLSFARPTTYAIPGVPFSGPWGAAIGDLNRDGKADLAVANAHSDDVVVLAGRGDGTFSVGESFPVDGRAPTSIATGDFNDDGRTDAAVPNAYTGDVSVMLGRGDGSFGTATTYATGRLPEQLAVGDLNGDGNLDLAVPNVDSNDISLLMGKGDGTFAAAVTLRPRDDLAGPFAIAIGDLNGDGHADLAVANVVSTSMSVLLADDRGGFTARKVPVGRASAAVVISDINADGKLDLAFASASANSVSVLPGRGDGTFGAASTFPAGAVPQRLAVVDLNGDGKLDLATANFDSDHLTSSLSLFLGAGNGSFTRLNDLPAAPGLTDLAAGDLNGDEHADLVATNFLTDSVSIYIQRLVLCRVPNVRGSTVKNARQKLRAAHCSVGSITRVFSRTVRSGRVITQAPRPGVQLARDAKVGLVVSKGKKPH